MLLKIIIVIILFYVKKMHLSKCSVFHHHYENQLQETISKFTDFKQLNFSNCNLNITDLRLRPEKNVMLNNSLNFSGLNLNSLESFLRIHFSNINGIDLETNIRDDLKFTTNSYDDSKQFDYKHIIWHFELSHFLFYFNEKIINNETCNYELFKKTKGFLSQVHFLIMESDVIYSDKTCPLIFHNSIIQTLTFKKMSSSFIFNNKFAFIRNMPLNLFDSFNSNILQLQIILYHYDLDLNLLNEHVFESIMDLDIDGIIKSIQDDLFKSFTNLKQLRFRTQNIKGLFAFKNITKP